MRMRLVAALLDQSSCNESDYLALLARPQPVAMKEKRTERYKLLKFLLFGGCAIRAFFFSLIYVRLISLSCGSQDES